ncbi:hypothetical protein RUM44_005625 [Polyplax serrata]|uniref:Uncharacterized protein n=1 Tax=Polyplax serrata TaxID=468196 RepID=A0ABR1ADW9_POLSC
MKRLAIWRKEVCFLHVSNINTTRNGVISTIPITPTPLKNFPKLCEQRRKFSVLYKVEFQVGCNKKFNVN